MDLESALANKTESRYVGKPMLIYQIGECEFVPSERLVRRNGQRFELSQKQFQVLEILIGRQGEVVSREDFIKAVWSDEEDVYADECLTSAIYELRSAFADRVRKYIKTAPTHGYQLVMPAISREKRREIPIVSDNPKPEELPQTPGKEPEKQSFEKLVSVTTLAIAGHKKLAIAILAVLLIAVVLILGGQFLFGPSRPRTIAVLPFAVSGQNADDVGLGGATVDTINTKL